MKEYTLITKLEDMDKSMSMNEAYGEGSEVDVIESFKSALDALFKLSGHDGVEKLELFSEIAKLLVNNYLRANV